MRERLSYMKWIKSNLSKILLIFAIIIIIVSYCLSLYSYEKKEYESYADYTRADIVMTLTFNKEFQFYTTRYVQSFNNDKKISEGELIYDYAQYNFLPILNYLHKPSEDEELINSFSNFLSFYSDYYVLTLKLRENIFSRQENGKYFTRKDGIYTYYVKMNVIGKAGLNSVYTEYLKCHGYQSIEDKFLNDLYLEESIKTKYSYNELQSIIRNNFDMLYYGSEKEIIKVITSDINSFLKYIYTYYIELNTEDNSKLVLLKEIETEPLELTFNLRKKDRIYKSASKYYKYSYILDINDVWDQLKEKGYPKIYS